MESLSAIGGMADREIDLAEAALLLASVFHPGMALDRYRHHIGKLCDETAQDHRGLLKAGAEDTLETRLAALRHVLFDRHGYEVDTAQPDHIQNADLMRVIDRGRGGASAVSLLYIHAAAAQGWDSCALDIAGHLTVRMDKDGRRLVFDPSEGGRILQASDLRRLVKAARGPHAELSADYYEPLPRRAILIRLQNHIKLRQIEAHDYEGALASVEAMRVLDPDEYRLLLDAGVLCARTGRKAAAIAALEVYIAKAPDIRDRQEAAMLLREVRLMPE